MGEQESKIVPNSFQTPNAYVDEAMHLLTPEEYVVLSFIDRHILGWQEKVMERKGVISLTMIVEGYQSKKTGRWFHGTGLSRPTVNKCLDALTCYGFIVPEGKPTVKGQTWVLGDYPDYDALRERQQENQKRINERMSKVRGKSDLPVNATDGALVNVTTPVPTIYDLRKQRHLERQSSKTKEKELTTSAVADIIFAPSSNNDCDIAQEASDSAMFPVEGKKQKSARAEKAEKRLSKTATTTEPIPLPPSHLAPIATEHVSAAASEAVAVQSVQPAKTKNQLMAEALGEAWGGPIANSEFALYIKQAKALALDIPVEEFKAYCDWRKQQAGDWASRLMIAQLTGKGYVSAYLQQRHERLEKDRKNKEAEERLYAQNPHLRPRDPSEPVEYATPEELRALLSSVLKPQTQHEDAS